MPCNGLTDHEQLWRVRDEYDALNKAMCWLLTELERRGTVDECIKGNLWLSEWWRLHKEQDAARLKAEEIEAQREIARGQVAAIRAAALLKLTPEERAALGLNR